MIIVQDFETVTFYVLFVYKPTFSVIFCWIKRVRVSRKFNSLFILYISIAKPIKGVYWSEDKQTRHLVSFDLANFEMSKIYQGNFQSLCRLAQLFRNTSAVNCRLVDYKYWKSGHYTFILFQLWAILCQWPKRFMIFHIESKQWITLLNQTRF